MDQRPKQTHHQRRHHVKRCSPSCGTRRRGVKHTETTATVMVEMQNSDSTQCWRGCGHANSPQCPESTRCSTLADSLLVSFKPKHTLTHCPATMLLGISQRSAQLTATWRPAQGACGNSAHNCQVLEATKVSFSRRVGKLVPPTMACHSTLKRNELPRLKRHGGTRNAYW